MSIIIPFKRNKSQKYVALWALNHSLNHWTRNSEKTLVLCNFLCTLRSQCFRCTPHENISPQHISESKKEQTLNLCSALPPAQAPPAHINCAWMNRLHLHRLTLHLLFTKFKSIQRGFSAKLIYIKFIRSLKKIKVKDIQDSTVLSKYTIDLLRWKKTSHLWNIESFISHQWIWVGGIWRDRGAYGQVIVCI